MIAFSKHSVPKKIKNIFNEILKTGWFTHGKYTEYFENEFKKFTGAKYCTVVSSLYCRLTPFYFSFRFKKNSEVLVPAMSHTATSHAAEYANLKVKFVDVDPKSGNIQYDEIVKKYFKEHKSNNGSSS